MTVSVVIATLDRQERVRGLVSQLLRGSRLPEEIVIVEQGDRAAAEASVAALNPAIPVRVVFESTKSVARARNRGVDETTGDILMFFDDDMGVDQEYVRIAAEYLENHPRALGVTGSFMRDEPVWTYKRVLGALFLVYSWKPRNVVLPSGSYDYIRGESLKREQEVEWLYGGNMVLRRGAFSEGRRFDPRLLRWSFGEDVMFTYALHKQFPGSLRYLPDLLVTHACAQENKMVNEEVVRMKVLYRFLFWHAHVRQKSPLSGLAYVWSQIGLAGLELLLWPRFRTVAVLLSSYAYLVRRHRSILQGTTDVNNFIFAQP